MQRGEVWWRNLDPTIGAEQQKKRPCVIVNDDAVPTGDSVRHRRFFFLACRCCFLVSRSRARSAARRSERFPN